MTQKKKTDFKIITPPDDLESEVRAKTKKIHREKLKIPLQLFLLLLR